MTFVYHAATDGYELDAVDPTATGFLNIPDTYSGKDVTVIGDQACSPNYNGIPGLTGVRLPAHLETIDDAAFHNCSGLTGSLTIPAGVTSIDGHAFFDCSGLSEVCWLGAPPSIGSLVFDSTTATHYVPGQHLDAYRALEGLSGAQVKFILTPSLSGSNLIISFFAVNNTTYQPQASTDLQSWSNHGNTISGDDTTKSFTAPANSTHAYFRLQSQ